MDPLTRTPRRPTCARAGFSVIEVMIAFTVFAIAAGGATSMLLQARRLDSFNREMSAAIEAADGVLEQMYGADFDELFARFNADPLDDPDLAGSAHGASFAVPSLARIAGDPDGMAGEIVFPSVAGALREDMVLSELCMPRDLDLDGVVDDQDHAGDYRLLPVLIRVEWSGVGGNQTYELLHTLSTVSD